MAEQRYNGWESRETWVVNLWLSNEEPSYRGTLEMARECWDESDADRTFTRRENAISALADRLRDDFEEANPVGDKATVWADLMGTALAAVNWHEIAGHWVDDVAEDEPAPTADAAE